MSMSPEKVAAALDQNPQAVLPEEHRQQDEIGFTEVIWLEGDGAAGVFPAEALDRLQPHRPHVERVAPGQIVDQGFERADFVVVVRHQVEHRLHLVVEIFFHACRRGLCSGVAAAAEKANFQQYNTPVD
jgi:hypothetical protein